MCAYKRKTWAEKLNIDRKPLVEKSDKNFGDIKAGQLMLIPTPRLVDRYIRDIPKGTHVDKNVIRKDLAAQYDAEVTCPLTTGIFIRIVAEAAYEEYLQGKPLSKITPFWRVIDTRSPVAKKLSFGTALLEECRKKEGISTT